MLISFIIYIVTNRKKSSFTDSAQSAISNADVKKFTIDDLINSFKDKVDAAPGIPIEDTDEFNRKFIEKIRTVYFPENGTYQPDEEFESKIIISALEILKGYGSPDPKVYDASNRLDQIGVTAAGLSVQMQQGREINTTAYWKKILIDQTTLTFFKSPAGSYPFSSEIKKQLSQLSFS